MTDYAALYRESRERIEALVRNTSDEQRARTVPGCPKWTISDAVAHLAANAADGVAGRLTGIPTDEETAAQIEQRRSRPLDEVLAEWDVAAGPIEQGLAAGALPLAFVQDVLVHEADIRGALGAGEPKTAVEVDAYEFWRSMPGRRSRAQMAAWKWSGDPEPYLQAIPIFGPTDVDLAEPAGP